MFELHPSRLDMDKRLGVTLVAAALLAGGAAFHFSQGRDPGPRDGARGAQRRDALEQCLQAARMTFDVHWAAACTRQAEQGAPGAGDGHAECDLPDDKAAPVNAWLNDAEARCMAEARAEP
jgi:hypothetical protein